jgi:uncharacterized membrane protein
MCLTSLQLRKTIRIHSTHTSGGNNLEQVQPDPIETVVAVYQNHESASSSLDKLKQAEKDKEIDLKNIALVTKDIQDGKLKLHESHDFGALKGGLAGAGAGALVALLLGPLAIPVAAGAAIGAIAGKLSDGGFDDKWLKELGGVLEKGDAIIVASMDPTWTEQVKARMEEGGATVIRIEAGEDILKKVSDASNL